MPLTSTYSNNTSTPAPATTVGFKISKPGYNALTTTSSNMVFDSSWPSLPIAYETTIPNPITSSSSTAIVAHNLKFPPFTMIWSYGPDASGVANASHRYFPMLDLNNVYLNGNQLDSSIYTATQLKIRCFQLDLSVDIDYTLAPGDTLNGSYDNSFGVKVVKPGKDINSRDLRDFALHSRAQSPLILAVKTQKTMPSSNIGTGIGNVIQYASNLKYPAWVYGYVKQSTGTYEPAPYYSQAYPRTFTDGITSYIGYTGTDIGATLVILRDPMFAATTTTVQF